MGWGGGRGVVCPQIIVIQWDQPTRMVVERVPKSLKKYSKKGVPKIFFILMGTNKDDLKIDPLNLCDLSYRMEQRPNIYAILYSMTIEEEEGGGGVGSPCIYYTDRGASK